MDCNECDKASKIDAMEEDTCKQMYDSMDIVGRRDRMGTIISRTTTNKYRENFDLINWGHGDKGEI